MRFVDLDAVDQWDFRSLFLQGGGPQEVKNEVSLGYRYSVREIFSVIGLPYESYIHKRRMGVRRRQREKAVEKKYGISRRQYRSLKRHQEFSCAVCSRRDGFESGGQSLSVDFDYKRGEVRGLLCSKCRHLVTGLAGVKDPLSRVSKAQSYLANPPFLKVAVGEESRELSELAVSDFHFSENRQWWCSLNVGQELKLLKDYWFKGLDVSQLAESNKISPREVEDIIRFYWDVFASRKRDS